MLLISMRSIPVELVQAVEGGSLITFGERWVVKDCIHKVVHRATQYHYCLSYVKKLAGSLADDMNTEQELRFAMKDQLQPPRCIAADLAARNLAIVCHSYFVRHIFVGELLLSLADE